MNNYNAVDRHNRTAVDLPAAVAQAFPDSKAVSQMFADDSSFVIAEGTVLNGRAAIKKYFDDLTAGADKWGTSLRGVHSVAEVEWKLELSESTVIIRTRGGLIFPGELEVAPERRGVQTWTVHREGDQWLVVSYQNTRVLDPS